MTTGWVIACWAGAVAATVGLLVWVAWVSYQDRGQK